MATVSIPFTCGELVQGLWEGVPALVSCPIDHFSTAHLILNSTYWQLPAASPKTEAALQAGCSRLDWEGGGILELETPAPRGRGYGTSTADIASSLYALGCAIDHELEPSFVAEIAVGVEPSDSTIFPGLTLFDHRRGAFHQTWDTAPPLNVILIDPGGAVDTIRFNQLDHHRALKELESIHQEAFQLLKSSLTFADWEMFGQATSLSAQAHQRILDNPLLDRAFRLADQTRSLGVCRAHSGTILGLIIDPLKENIEEVAAYARPQLPTSVSITCHRIVDGGPRYLLDQIGVHHVTARTHH